MFAPTLNNPISICMSPVRANMTIKTGKAFSMLPEILTSVAIMKATTTVIAPTGELICVSVPPNTTAINPRIIAVYIPAMGPNPVATPYAKATGRVTIPAEIPPNKSCRKLSF